MAADQRSAGSGGGAGRGGAGGAGGTGAGSGAGSGSGGAGGDGAPVRIDSWIWSVRLTKTRSLAAAACRAGHVRVNGERVKAAYAVRPGDEVRMRQAGRERIVVVTRLVRKRVGAEPAAACYLDNSPPPPSREEAVPVAQRERGAGRPSKRDRRALDRLRGGGGLSG